jgi:hypothetical protein
MRHFMASKTYFALCVWLVLVTVPVHYAHADVWGSTWGATIWKQFAETFQIQIQGISLGTAKNAAVQVIISQVNGMVGGNGLQGPMYITDWQQFLYDQPQQKTRAYMNDFFTLTTGGRASSLNYRSIAQSGASGTVADGSMGKKLWLSQEGIVAGVSTGAKGGSSGNYPAYLKEAALRSINNPIPKMDLLEYTSSPDAMFREGNWKAFNAFFTNEVNNPFGYTLLTQKIHDKKLAAEEEKAATIAKSYNGYTGKMDGDKVSLPGGTAEKLFVNAQDLQNKMLTGATTPSELAASLAANAAVKQIQELFQGKGIGSSSTSSRSSGTQGSVPASTDWKSAPKISL